MEKLRILDVGRCTWVWERLIENSLDCIVDHDISNPLDYNVAIIHASDDGIVDGVHSLSEWLKLKNPNIITIGTSSLPGGFENDQEAKQRYDERISVGEYYLEDLKETLEKYGFEFPQRQEDIKTEEKKGKKK